MSDPHSPLSETAEAIEAEHRLCGPKYDGCYAHYPWMAHCRADGMAWPCDVESLRAIRSVGTPPASGTTTPIYSDDEAVAVARAATPPEPVGGREAREDVVEEYWPSTWLGRAAYAIHEVLTPNEDPHLGGDMDPDPESGRCFRLADAALQASPPTGVPDALGVAWAEAEAALPDGWLFQGVELADHSMEGGGWGPDWMASMSWPGHCEYDDCDHDEAFRVTHDASPTAALRALAREQADSEPTE